MKISIITGIFPPDIGGPAIYVERLARELSQRSHRVTVITLTSAKEKYPEYPFQVTRIHRSIPLVFRLCLIFIRIIISGWHAQLLYVNGLELPAVIANVFLRIPMVMKVTGDFAWERTQTKGWSDDDVDQFQNRTYPWQIALLKWVRTFYTRRAHFIITPSNYLKSIVCGWGIESSRVKVIYNAPPDISLSEIEASSRQKILGRDKLQMITIGRLVPWKGVADVVSLLPHLGDKVHLLVVGEGPEEDNIIRLAKKLGVEKQLRLAGKSSHSEVLVHLKNSDILILNSGYEGFSHTLLEAMSVETPVVTTRKGGNEELICHDRDGILFEYGNLEEMKEQLKLLLADSAKRERLAKNARKRLENFPWSETVKETVLVFEKALKISNR